jgi:hypothetical protein
MEIQLDTVLTSVLGVVESGLVHTLAPLEKEFHVPVELQSERASKPREKRNFHMPGIEL